MLSSCAEISGLCLSPYYGFASLRGNQALSRK